MVLIIQYIIGFCLLGVALYFSMRAFTTGPSGIADLFISLPFAIAAYIFLKDLLINPIVKKFESFYLPKGFDNGPEYSLVDTFIQRQDYPEALKMLNAILEENPDSSLGYYKKCVLLYEKMNQLENAIQTAYARFSAPELNPKDEKLIFLTLDILSDNSYFKEEKELIAQILPKMNDISIKSRLMKRNENLQV
jgi:tetratricopeptide (TPR) repeat protein